MAIYALSDLHLSFSADKPMHIFKGWDDYENRIRRNWMRLVREEDAVVLPGDLSWGLKLEDTLEDFRFLENLPGQKFILKGNHDLWWTSKKKMEDFFAANDLHSIRIVHNNAYPFEGVAICGTRGWVYDGTAEADRKVILREAGRLRTSLEAALATGLPPAVFLHYPPVYGENVCEEIVSILKAYGIADVYYGHIHGNGIYNAVREYERIKLHLVSCDCVDFTPVPVQIR